jgi:hypothetical protein
MVRTMKIVSEINTRQELDEMKSIMEVFVVNDRIRQLAQMS